MLLQLQNIQKRFGGVVALRNGSLDINAGEVHLLMGENGAGKSTLMKIVADAGTRLRGNTLAMAKSAFLTSRGSGRARHRDGSSRITFCCASHGFGRYSS